MNIETGNRISVFPGSFFTGARGAQIGHDGQRVVVTQRLRVGLIRHLREQGAPVATDPFAHRAHDLAIGGLADARVRGRA
jgi:hypothetical protein